MTALLSVDTSAWHHSAHQVVADRWHTALHEDRIGICDQVRLEILFSARSADDLERVADRLAGLRIIPQDSGTSARALEVQRALAGVGGLHHRSVKIAGLVIAAAAEAAGATVARRRMRRRPLPAPRPTERRSTAAVDLSRRAGTSGCRRRIPGWADGCSPTPPPTPGGSRSARAARGRACRACA